MFFLALELATDAQVNAGEGPAPRLRDRGLALPKKRAALTFRQPAAGQLYGVIHTGVDLLLYRPVTGPATRHNKIPS